MNEIQAKNAALAASNGDSEEGRISLTKANMDSDIYGGINLSGYNTSIPADDIEEYEVRCRLVLLELCCAKFRKISNVTFCSGRY